MNGSVANAGHVVRVAALRAPLLVAVCQAAPGLADHDNPVLESLRLPWPATTPATPVPVGTVPDATPAGMALAGALARACLPPGGVLDAVGQVLQARGAVSFPAAMLDDDDGQPGLRGRPPQDAAGVDNVVFDRAGTCTVSARLDRQDGPSSIARTAQLAIQRRKGVPAFARRLPPGLASISAFEMDTGDAAVMRISLYGSPGTGAVRAMPPTRALVARAA